MTKTLKRMTALALALILVAGQVAIPTAAADEENVTETTQEILELPTVTGGEQTEAVEVTVTTEKDGGIVATVTTTDGNGVTTESGLTVEVQGSSTEDSDGNSHSELTYEASNAEGTYEVEGGETEDVEIPEVEDLTADIISTPPAEGEEADDSAEPVIKSSETVTNEDGSTTTKVVYEDGSSVETITYADGTVKTTVTNGESKTETTPTHEGDNLKSENPANYDQTTVDTEARTLEVTYTATTTTGDPDFMAAEGDVVILEDGLVVGYYTAEEFAALEEQPEGAVTLNGNTLYRDDAGEVVGYVDDEGNVVGFDVESDGYDYFSNGRSQGSVGYMINWSSASGAEFNLYGKTSVAGTPTEWYVFDEDGALIDGLYCLDGSITTKPYGEYRLANIEDGVEDGYYSEEEVAHLRAIAALGYSWSTKSSDGSVIPDNIDEVNEVLTAAGLQALTSDQAATVTQAAIWYYGNRYGVESSDLILSLSKKVWNEENKKNEWVPLSGEELANLEAAFNYLISDDCVANHEQKQAANTVSTETEIINEEKFIENMNFTVQEKVEGLAVNEDDDDTNDVYYTTLKFSMVVTPTDNDDLIVKVLDAAGNVVKEARIAGEVQEGETKAEKDADGFYILDGIQLSENSNSTFSLKLEGSQKLQEGVYIFESAVSDELAMNYIGLTQEEWDAMSEGLREQYRRSQNFITTMGGTAQVDVSTAINLTFNVDEAKITTTREWRSEYDPSAQSGDGEPDGGTPTGGGGGFEMRFIPAGETEVAVVIAEEPIPLADGVVVEDAPAIEVVPQVAADGTLTILDEEVPLAEAPETGDATILWGIMGLVSMAGSAMLGKKKEEI